MTQYLTTGIELFNGDPSAATPEAVEVPIPREGRGWGYLHVLTAAHATDTTVVAIHGKLHANANYIALKKSDQSTATTVTQVGGALKEEITTVQLMPYMKVVLSGTSTSGASTKVWLEAHL